MINDSESIVPPIVVSDQEHRGRVWVNVFASEADLTSQLEGWYATEEDYRAFDSAGRPLVLVETNDVVTVELRSHESDETALRQLLTRFLVEQRKALDLDARLATSELIERVTALQ